MENTKLKTVNVKDGENYRVINESEFDPEVHEFHLKDTEIIVKPKGIKDAEPFVIEEKDFDAAAYDRVNATQKNLKTVAGQTERKTLGEKDEDEEKSAKAKTSSAKEKGAEK